MTLPPDPSAPAGQRRWRRAEQLVWRSVVPVEFGGQEPHVGYAQAMTVVEHTDRALVASVAAGAPVARRTGRRGPGGRNMHPGGWDGGYARATWTGRTVVKVHEIGRPWSVWRWLEEGGAWTDWCYVNLEVPWRATPLGYDSQDLILDVIVHDDGRIELKDSDELDWSVEVGTISAQTAERVRAVGRRAVSSARRREWPFDADWDAWRPDAAWPLPSLPHDWQRLWG